MTASTLPRALDRRVLRPVGALCLCGDKVQPGHACSYTEGTGWCRRCLADEGDPTCCTEERLARVTRRVVGVASAECGCPVDAGCGHAPRKPFPVRVTT